MTSKTGHTYAPLKPSQSMTLPTRRTSKCNSWHTAKLLAWASKRSLQRRKSESPCRHRAQANCLQITSEMLPTTLAAPATISIVCEAYWTRMILALSVCTAKTFSSWKEASLRSPTRWVWPLTSFTQEPRKLTETFVTRLISEGRASSHRPT